jgi:RNA polymerase sigma factor (sigma-70 family)
MKARGWPPIPDMEPLASEPARSAARPTFEHVFPFAHRYVRHSVRELGIPERDRDDVTQDVLVAVHRSFGSYDPTRPLKPWLKTITYRVAKDYRLLARNKRELLFPEPSVDVACVEPTSEDLAARRQLQRTLLEILSTMELGRRMVFVLHDLEEVSIDDIADASKIPVSTARTRLRLARCEVQAGLRRRQAREKRWRAAGALVIPASMQSLVEAGRHLPHPESEAPSASWKTARRALAHASSAAPPALGAAWLRGATGAIRRWSTAKLALAGGLTFALGGAAGMLSMRPSSTSAAQHDAEQRSAEMRDAATRGADVREAPHREEAARSRPAQEADQAEEAPPAARAARGDTTATAPSKAAGVPPENVKSTVLPASRPVPPAASQGSAEDTALRETRLLRAASAAMDGGDLAASRELLHRYAREFPRGSMKSEYLTMIERLRALEGAGATPAIDAGSGEAKGE